METYKVKFHRISVYGDIDNIRYRVILDQDIPGYKIDTNGQIVKTTVNYIDILPSALIAQTIRCIPNLGIIHAYLVEKNLRGTGKRIGIDAAQLQAYLTNADVTLERTEFHPGEEYTTIDGEVRTHEFDGYTTNIKDIVVTTNAESIADRVIDRIMLGGIWYYSACGRNPASTFFIEQPLIIVKMKLGEGNSIFPIKPTFIYINFIPFIIYDKW